MDMSKLAELMLEWEKVTKQAERLEEHIRKHVLEHGETVIAGNVQAVYYKERGKFGIEKNQEPQSLYRGNIPALVILNII